MGQRLVLPRNGPGLVSALAREVEEDGLWPLDASATGRRAPCGARLFPTADSPAELLLGGGPVGPAGTPNVWG